MPDLLISPPWWLYGSVIIAGLIVWVSGNKRTDTRIRWTGIGILAVGIFMAVLSFLVETDGQKVNRQSKELVQAAVDQNWDKMKSLMTPDVKLSLADLPLYHGRDEVMRDAQVGIKAYGLHGASAAIEETKKQDYIISTTVRVYSTGDVDPGHPLPSLWQLDWEKAADGRWAIRDIRALEIGNNKGSELAPLIQRVR